MGRAVGLGTILFCLALAEAAAAIDLVGATEATFEWEPATGPVASYAVFVWRSSGAEGELEQLVASSRATVAGRVDETLMIQVAARDDAGNLGPLSAPSEPVTFLAAPPPPPPGDVQPPADDPPAEPPPSEDPPGGQLPPPGASEGVLFSEDFEGYSDGEDPTGWFDTGARNSLEEAPALFETFALTDGSVAFGTSSTLLNTHSHVLVAGSAAWQGYELTGWLSISDPRGGIGVTVLSDYPRSDAYYRVRRHKGDGAFYLANHGGKSRTCIGATQTDVVPVPGAWYHIRVQTFPQGPDVRIRARVWADGSAEPQAWPIDCLGPGAAELTGTVGLWSAGRGLKLWDDIVVTSIGQATSPVQDPLDPPLEAPSAGERLAVETFDGYRDGADPDGWLDTAARNSTSPADVFEVFALRDGTAAFGTQSTDLSVHSHWVALPADLSSYELRGRMWIEDDAGGIGVTFYSDYPSSSRYYRLRRSSSAPSFHFASRPDTQCEGVADTGVVPQPGDWYRFRVLARPEVGGGTRMRAKVWREDTAEPGWQADCVDPSALRTSGVPGIWSKGRGLKLWDELEVFSAGE